jgi:hypothetical protein
MVKTCQRLVLLVKTAIRTKKSDRYYKEDRRSREEDCK